MEPISKTNECLRQIQFVRGCYPRILNIKDKHTNWSEQYRRQDFEIYWDSLQQGLAVLMFRCLPPNNIKFAQEPTNGTEPIGGIPAMVVWNVCKEFEKVTLSDIENELYDMVDTPQNLPQYKLMMYNRFEEYLTYPKEIENKKTPYTQSLVDDGVISEYEQVMFVQDLNRFSFTLRCVVRAIRELYSNVDNDAEIKSAKQQNDETKERDPKILQILRYNNDNYDDFLTEIKGKNLRECARVFSTYIKTNKAVKPSNLRGSLKWMQDFLQEFTGETKPKQTFCRWVN